jgi:hypothetical protein
MSFSLQVFSWKAFNDVIITQIHIMFSNFPNGVFKGTSKAYIVLNFVMNFSSSWFSHTTSQETILEYTGQFLLIFSLGFYEVFNNISTHFSHFSYIVFREIIFMLYLQFFLTRVFRGPTKDIVIY